ncbi:MAG: hypothetical protein Q3X06_05080 [Clostridia bacterium]|jgi:hypothetical protein|nr:hypothetical protein [Clostridia bacterium]
MKVELKANGKTVQVEMTEEQAKILGLVEERSRTGYERVDEDDSYFVDDTINDGHEVIGGGGTLVNDLYYNNGNYYNDETIVENNARADKLFRCLRQWQGLNDKAITKKDWKGYDVIKYNIDYDYLTNRLLVRWTGRYRKLNVVYFTSEEKAKEAIKVFEDELLWYYTEYVQRLDEVQND